MIDSRDIEVAGRTAKNARVVEEHDGLAQVRELLAKRVVKRLYAAEDVSVAYAGRLRAALPDVEVDLSPVLSQAIRALRVIKEPEALERLKPAQRCV